MKRLYHALFRGGKNLRRAVAEAQQQDLGEHARALVEFIAASKRGVCRDASHLSASGDEA